VESKLAGKTGTTIKDVEFISKTSLLYRPERGIKKKGRAIQTHQTFHSLETNKSRAKSIVDL